MDPPTILLEQLAEARRADRAFEEVWPRAVETALAAASKRQRIDWASVFAGHRGVWRGAYERRPPARAEVAVRELVASAGEAVGTVG